MIFIAMNSVMLETCSMEVQIEFLYGILWNMVSQDNMLQSDIMSAILYSNHSHGYKY